jgi:Arc/MetJ-type ribon-helix-helix transcriptional regulator
MTSYQREPGIAPAARPNTLAGGSKARPDASERTSPRVPEGASGGTPFGTACPPRPTTGGRVLSVRVSREEAQAFDAAIASAGFQSRSEALRSLIRGAGGAIAPLPEETELLATIARELHKIGVNVNQIALAANRRQIALMRAEWDEIGHLRELLPEVRLAIGRLVYLRRHAGRAALGRPAGKPKPVTGQEVGDA